MRTITGQNVVLVKNKDIDKFLKNHPNRQGDCKSCTKWYNLAKKQGNDILYDDYTGDIIGILDATRTTVKKYLKRHINLKMDFKQAEKRMKA